MGEIDKCMKCGNCMAVCPVYGVDKSETAVTRSKIAIAEAVLKGTPKAFALRGTSQPPLENRCEN